MSTAPDSPDELTILRRNDARYGAVLLASAAIVWIASPEGKFVEPQPGWEDYTGQPWEEHQYDGWISAIHPDDRAAVSADWMAAVRSEGPIYRTHGRIWSARRQSWRAFQTRGVPVRDSSGKVIEWVGALTDVQDSVDAQEQLADRERNLERTEELQRLAEDKVRFLMQEVDHRSNNLLAIVQSIVRLSRAESPSRLREVIEGRIQALARTHQLLAASRWTGAELAQLVREELAPYALEDVQRIVISGDPVSLAPRQAQGLSLALHELATNAAKYGALSIASGRVDVSWFASEGRIERLVWQEDGGPPVAPPTRQGMGSVVLSRAGESFGARAELEWPPTGLRCVIRFPK